MNKGEQRCVSANFEAADDLLWQAVAGRLPQLPSLTLVRSGHIGPLVELAIARMTTPDAYRGVTVEPPIFHQVERALADGTISGAGAGDRVGVFPLAGSIRPKAPTTCSGISGRSTPKMPLLPLVWPKAWPQA